MYVNLDGGTGRIRAATVYEDDGTVLRLVSSVLKQLGDVDVVGAISRFEAAPSDSDYFPFAVVVASLLLRLANSEFAE